MQLRDVESLPICVQNIELSPGIAPMESSVSSHRSLPIGIGIEDGQILDNPLSVSRMRGDRFDQKPLMWIVFADLFPLHGLPSSWMTESPAAFSSFRRADLSSKAPWER
jgi:hypothetical protein